MPQRTKEVYESHPRGPDMGSRGKEPESTVKSSAATPPCEGAPVGGLRASLWVARMLLVGRGSWCAGADARGWGA